jgi:hypothetical protein
MIGTASLVTVILVAITVIGTSYHDAVITKSICVFLSSCVFFSFSYFAHEDRFLVLQSIRSLRWLRSEATILTVEDNSFEIGSANEYTPARSTRYCELRCTYNYRVDGCDYRGDRYSFGGHLDQGWPPLSPGDSISIYYDKDNPSQSVVRRGVCPTLCLSPILALTALASTLWILANHGA